MRFVARGGRESRYYAQTTNGDLQFRERLNWKLEIIGIAKIYTCLLNYAWETNCHNDPLTIVNFSIYRDSFQSR